METQIGSQRWANNGLCKQRGKQVQKAHKALLFPHLQGSRGHEICLDLCKLTATHPHTSMPKIHLNHLCSKTRTNLQTNTHTLRHTLRHASAHLSTASFPHCLCETPVSAITRLHPGLAILSLASTLHPRVMNYGPPTGSWVDLQK